LNNLCKSTVCWIGLYQKISVPQNSAGAILLAGTIDMTDIPAFIIVTDNSRNLYGKLSR
jgi:hypothetical protein